MTIDQINGPLRVILPTILAYLAGRKIIPESSIPDFATFILAGVAAFWSWWSNRQAALVAKVNAMPEVAGIVTAKSPEGAALAQSIPSSTVARAGTPAAASIAS